MQKLSLNDLRIVVNGVALYTAAAQTKLEQARGEKLLKRLFKAQMKLHHRI